MIPIDTRRPCSSCGNRGVKLETCERCPVKICESCWDLHLNYDHQPKVEQHRESGEGAD